MPPGPGSYELGPSTGSLRVRTTRAGVAAAAGHDLLIEFGDWSGRLVLGRSPGSASRLSVDVDLGSLTVLDGSGGVAPLSDRDRREITSTARRLLDVEHHPDARFSASGTGPAGSGGAEVVGDLTMRGATAPVTLHVAESGPGSWTATATVLLSDLGIQPYRAMFGALRLADAVEVEVMLDLPAARAAEPEGSAT